MLNHSAQIRDCLHDKYIRIPVSLDLSVLNLAALCALFRLARDSHCFSYKMHRLTHEPRACLSHFAIFFAIFALWSRSVLCVTDIARAAGLPQCLNVLLPSIFAFRFVSLYLRSGRSVVLLDTRHVRRIGGGSKSDSRSNKERGR